MKCAHAGCKCQGELERGGQKFCSEECASLGPGGGAAVRSSRPACNCGHPGCK
jgi:hypothetical protein